MQYENEAKSTEDSAICTLRIRSLKAKHLCMSWRACSPVLTLTDRDGSAWPPWHWRLAGLAGSCPVCRGDAMSKWRFGCSSEWLLLIVWKLSRVLGWLAPKASQTASPQAVLAARARHIPSAAAPSDSCARLPAARRAAHPPPATQPVRASACRAASTADSRARAPSPPPASAARRPSCTVAAGCARPRRSEGAPRRCRRC